MDIPAIVIGSIALALTLVQIGHAAFRRFLRRPEFRVQWAVAVIDQTLTEGSRPQVLLGNIQLAVIALGGGQAETIVDSRVALKGPTLGHATGPAIEIEGEKVIPIPADTPTKFSQSFRPGIAAESADELDCRLSLDSGYRTYRVDFVLTRQGDQYRFSQRREWPDMRRDFPPRS